MMPVWKHHCCQHSLRETAAAADVVVAVAEPNFTPRFLKRLAEAPASPSTRTTLKPNSAADSAMQRVTAELDDLLAGDSAVTRGRTKTVTSSGGGVTRTQRRSTSAVTYGGRPEWVPANSKKVPAAAGDEGLGGNKGRAASASPHRRSTWSTRPVTQVGDVTHVLCLAAAAAPPQLCATLTSCTPWRRHALTLSSSQLCS